MNRSLTSCITRALVTILFFLIALSNNGCSSDSITLVPISIDFGTIAEGTVVDRVIKIKNDSNHRIYISGITTSCHCTTTTKIDSISPKTVASFHVKFDSTLMPGPAKKMVSVAYSVDGKSHEAAVDIHGTVVASASILPSQIVDFGNMSGGQTKNLEVEVVRSNGKEIRINKIPASGGVKAKVKRMVGARATIVVSAKASAVAGQYSQTITIPFSDGTNAPPLMVRYFVPSAYRLSPPKINFGTLMLGAESSQFMDIQGQNIDRLSMEKVPKEVEVNIVKRDSRHMRLLVKYHNATLPGSVYHSKIILTTQNSSEPSIGFPVYAVTVQK